MNVAEAQLASIGQRQRRLEGVLVSLMLAPDSGRSIKDEVRRGYTDAGRHAMADPPEGQGQAYELGYLARKMEG